MLAWAPRESAMARWGVGMFTGIRPLTAATAGLAAFALACGPSAFGATATASDRGPAVAGSGSLTWSARLGPVPGVTTATTPAATTITFPGQKPTALLVWTGRRQDDAGYQISYASATSLPHNRWTKPQTIQLGTTGAAVTQFGPAAAPYGSSTRQVIVAWRATGQPGQIWYSIGTAVRPGVLAWSPASLIPGAVTSGGPAIYHALHSAAVLAVWHAASGNQLEYAVGTPLIGADSLKWSPPAVIRGSSAAGRPTIAEVSTNDATGTIFVIWRRPGIAGRIERAATGDPLSARPGWTAPVAFPATVATSAPPAALAIGTDSGFPLLIAYRALHGQSLSYFTMARDRVLSPVRTVPRLTSLLQPALADQALFARAVGNGSVHYQTFIRPCPRC